MTPEPAQPAESPEARACPASPDHADVIETIQNAADDWQKQGYTTALAEVRDMANVGRALMEALPDGYSYMNCPSEIVSDLQNDLSDALAATTARPTERGAVEAMQLARPIVEADLEAAKEQGDADWEGMSFTALEAIDAALAQPATDQAVEVEALREGLAVAKRAILKAAQDTLWCDDSPAETVVDRIDALLAEADGQQSFATALAAQPATGRTMGGEKYRHVKRGTVYEVVGTAELQTTDGALVDGSALIVYRGDDGKLWAREEGEFHDGRFTALQNGGE